MTAPKTPNEREEQAVLLCKNCGGEFETTKSFLVHKCMKTEIELNQESEIIRLQQGLSVQRSRIKELEEASRWLLKSIEDRLPEGQWLKIIDEMNELRTLCSPESKGDGK